VGGGRVRAAVVADGHGFGGAQVYARSLVAHAPAAVVCDVVTTAEHAPHLAPAVERRGGQVVVVPTSVRRPAAPELTAALRRLALEALRLLGDRGVATRLVLGGEGRERDGLAGQAARAAGRARRLLRRAAAAAGAGPPLPAALAGRGAAAGARGGGVGRPPGRRDRPR
jgi:hypothetical protein